jgi:hypothetical protein
MQDTGENGVMSLQSKREYLGQIRSRYRRAGRVYKSKILDEYCQVCGYDRKYAIKRLAADPHRPRRQPGRKPLYDKEHLLPVLKRVWLASDQMCSKRLRAALPKWLPHLAPLDVESKTQLLALIPATMDRLLRPLRVRYPGKGLGGTKPGTLLKHHIPIRTGNWDITHPGFIEADTVAHCGNSLAGDFVWSLVFTDIFSGWTQLRAIWNKGAAGIQEQIADLEQQTPFALEGFDCDNGSEFLNYPLLHYFTQRQEPVAFTRSRPYHKNDNAHVEQKNWTHVRQLLGWKRLENPQLVAPINDLYREEWSAYQNFFCPSMKLVSKVRVRSRYRKRYDPPQTPYERLLQSREVSPENKRQLQAAYARLNPFALKKTIELKLKNIFALNRVQQGESMNP